MIVKSGSRQDGSFGQLLQYINRPVKKGRKVILHNLQTNTNNCENIEQAIEQEFVQNQSFAKVRRGGVVLFHDVISLSVKDRKVATEEMLEDLGRRYLELKANRALAFCKVHYDKENIHLHLMISGNEANSQKQVRVSRAEFNEIKRKLEAYQKERYPELIHSVVHDGKNKHKKMSLKTGGRREQERSRRMNTSKGQSEKERVFTIVQRALLTCKNGEEDVSKHLETIGFSLYKRGNTVGVKEVKTGKKYRLKTLGLDSVYEQMIERGHKYSKTLLDKSTRRVRALGVASGVLGMIEREDYSGLEVKEKKKRETFEGIVRSKRRRRLGLER